MMHLLPKARPDSASEEERQANCRQSSHHTGPKLVLLFSGKRKSGKDYVTEQLLRRCA